MAFRRQNDSQFTYIESANQWPEISNEMQNDFAKNGYVIVKDLFNKTEVDKLCKALVDCQEFWDSSFKLSDREKKYYLQSQWMDPGTDILGMAIGNAKSCGIGEQVYHKFLCKLSNINGNLKNFCTDHFIQLLNRGEIYLYSGKLIMKPERTGGSVLWHQDYGYFYNNNAVFPDFVTCIFALTKSDRENGGLQVVPGSHLCGRINHVKAAGQQSADLERVDMILKHLPMIDADLGAGDCMFIHGNLLHKSEANDSDHKRWNFILTYNAKSNNPHPSTYNAFYGLHELQRFPADSILKCDDLRIHKRIYLDPKTNPNIDTKA